MSELIKSSNPKERVLGAALQLLNKYGYGAVSLSEISKELGQSRQSTYYHFTDSETVLLELADRWSNTGQHFALRALANTNEVGKWKILAIAQGLFDWMREEPELSKLGLTLYQLAPHVKKLNVYMTEARLAGRKRIKEYLTLNPTFKHKSPKELERIITSIHSHMYGYSFYIVAADDYEKVREYQEGCLTGLRALIETYSK